MNPRTKRFRAVRNFAPFIVGALLLAACSTSSTSDESSPDPSPGDDADQPDAPASPGATTGLTDTTIRIAFMIPDFGDLADSGIVPDLGDPTKQVEAYVSFLNDEGGLDGRSIEASYHVFNALDDTGAATRTACIDATEDDPPFLVVGLSQWSALGTLCVAEEHETPIIVADALTPSLQERTDGRAFSLAMDLSREYGAWADILDEAGELEDVTIGIVTGDDDPMRTEAVDALEAALSDLGKSSVEKVVLPCPSITCDQHETAIQRLEGAGVDFLFNALGPISSPTFIAAADATGYQPEYSFAAGLLSDTVTAFHDPVRAVIDGSTGVGDYGRPGPDDPPEIGDRSVECNQIYADFVDGEPHASGSDAAGFTNTGCVLLDIIRAGIEAVDGDLGQDSFVRGIESIGEYSLEPDPPATECGPADRPISFGPDKHDGVDFLLLVEFDAETGGFARPQTCSWVRVP